MYQWLKLFQGSFVLSRECEVYTRMNIIFIYILYLISSKTASGWVDGQIVALFWSIYEYISHTRVQGEKKINHKMVVK